MIQMDLFIKQKHIYILREWMCGYLGAGGKGQGTDWELGTDIYILLYFFLKCNSLYIHLLQQFQKNILVLPMLKFQFLYLGVIYSKWDYSVQKLVVQDMTCIGTTDSSISQHKWKESTENKVMAILRFFFPLFFLSQFFSKFN